MTSAPAIIHKLIETFEQNLESYRSGKNETELRREFLDKFFTALGWDVANEKGYDEAHKEVVHEFSVEVSGQQKKADYAFRTGTDKFDFLVEAKKPSVKIETSQDAAFQIRRYGWSAKLPINILTDFEHFAVYDCRAKPNYSDKASFGRILLVHYKEYVERWDEIAAIFSPEAVRTGSFAKYAEGMKGKKGTADVDDAFLQEIERWREALAKNIALRNETIDIAGLNYAVQMTIDRVVFLRICEERGIEPENQLLDLVTLSEAKGLRDHRKDSSVAALPQNDMEQGVYRQLCELFKRADTKYNSGLFHFRQEKEQNSRPDDLTLSLEIDDKVLKDIISNLYYPKSPYAFLYIPADILGQVYERFLGKVIRLTAGHSAKVEEKPEVRKAGGVYYTPTYIVDYIVKNTVGKLAEGKKPKEVENLRIVDPACGSGTFLLGAYQFLLDWHLNWYVENEPEKWEKQKALVKADGGYRLTTSKKKEILLNNIHGVDIDAQAVEVTKLSLLLKVLENASGQLGLGMERVLPDLGNNIKCGNSLIGFDYFEGQLLPDEEERRRVNPFDWKREFPQVFAKGGFDAVIGNPPYNAGLTDSEEQYLQTIYESVKTGRQDTAAIFVDKGLSVSKNLVMYLLPYRLISRKRNHGQFQQWLYHKSKIQQVVYLGKLSDFKNVNDEFMTLLVSYLSTSKTQMSVAYDITAEDIKTNSIQYHKISQDAWGPPNYDLNIRLGKFDQDLLKKINACSIQMGEIAESRDGIVPFIREKLVSMEQKDNRYKPLLGIRGYYHLGRYSHSWNSTYICYDIAEAKKYIKDKVELRKVQLRDESIFLKPEKILTAQDSASIKGTLDLDKFYVTNSIHSTYLKDEVGFYSIRYVLGLLNSKVVNYYHQSLVLKGQDLHPQVLVTNLPKLPIRVIDFSNPDEKAQHDKMVSLVESMLALHKSLAAAQSPAEKERLERQIAVTDKAIDSLVYELYGLTEEEIKIVEG